MRPHRSPQIVARQFWRGLLLACAMVLVHVAPASAGCTGLGCSCSISADPLDFGTYNPLASSNVDAVGNVSVTCGALILGALISYEVTLDPGGSGSSLNRSMSNGSGAMMYNLYTDSSHTQIWGDGSGGTDTITNSHLLSLIFSITDDIPIYGRIPTGQNAEAGSYSDTIVATVIF